MPAITSTSKCSISAKWKRCFETPRTSEATKQRPGTLKRQEQRKPREDCIATDRMTRWIEQMAITVAARVIFCGGSWGFAETQSVASITRAMTCIELATIYLQSPIIL